MKRSLLLIIFTTFVVSLLIFVSSCDLFKKDNPVSPSGDDKIELGDEIQLHSSQSNAGNTIIVSKPGDPLDGLSINIPDNTFSGSRVFKISSYEIKKHEFGQYVNPISPLIKITSTEGYADGIYELKIPVNIPQGSFPLVFIYDENLKKLEPLPVSNFDNSSVTIITRHFSTSSITGSSVKKDLPLLQAGEAYSKLFVSSMLESNIKQTPVISSGFKPGVDDWEFVNNGSYIASGGHCAGQNMGAFWYYYEKKLKGEPNLFGLLKKHPTLWQDNNRGYRFCSVLQQDLDWDNWIKNFFRKYIDREQDLDKLKFYMIAGAMLVTGEPQYVGISRQTGTYPDGTPKFGGHALICYQIEPTTGKLLISDPNFPATGQTISYVNDRFLPYEGKLNADDVVNAYPFITYNAKTALVDWPKISKRWKEIEDYKIGTVAPNTFPAYILWSPDSDIGFEITDEINIDFDTLNFRAIVPGLEVGHTIDGTLYGAITIYNDDGSVFSGKNSKPDMIFENPGSWKFGFEIIGYRDNVKLKSGDYKPLFIDFKWVTINYKKIAFKIIPNKMKGDVNTKYKWSFDVSSLPKDKKYSILWNFGENYTTSLMRKDNENFAEYTYSTPGIYKIAATLYDSNYAPIATDTSTAEIAVTGDISPSYGPKGQTILISGTGFGERNNNDEVTLHWTKNETNHDDYLAIKTISWSDNKIEAVVADESKNFIGKVYIKVRKSNGSSYKWFGPWNLKSKS